MDIGQVFLFIIIANALALLRFNIFSAFDKTIVIVGLIAIDLTIIVGYLLYSNSNVSFSQNDIAVFILLTLGVLSSVFYAIEIKELLENL